MNFKNWLINQKGLSLKTSELYCYYIQKTKHFIKEYNSSKNGSSKRLLYFSHLKWYEFKKMTFPDVESPKKTEDKIMRYITYDEYKMITENYLSKNVNWSVNGKALTTLTYIYGLRINEALNIKYSDIIDGSIVIKGKGGKVRTIPASPHLRAVSQSSKGYIIEYKGRKMKYSTARNILDDITMKIDIPKCSWHSFRHGFAVRLLVNKIDIYNISKLMGHKSLETTARYLKYDQKLIYDEFKKLGLYA